MTARRLRAYRPTPPARPARPSAEGRWVLAPGHYDGDGCSFPSPGHLVRVEASHD